MLTIQQMQSLRTQTQDDVDRIAAEHDAELHGTPFAAMAFDPTDSHASPLFPWGRS